MNETPTDRAAAPPPIDPQDEFYAGIWWVWDVPGLGLRAATLGECATEIKRLRAELEGAREYVGVREVPV